MSVPISKGQVIRIMRAGGGNEAQAGDADQLDCFLGEHQIENGGHYVQLKFTGQPTLAVCYECANPHLPTERKKFPQGGKFAGEIGGRPYYG